MIRSTNAREPGADDQHVEVFWSIGRFHRPISTQSAAKINGKETSVERFWLAKYPLSFRNADRRAASYPNSQDMGLTIGRCSMTSRLPLTTRTSDQTNHQTRI